jgi:[ribosomal protein S18]-alanine N-acetyltransferase
MAYIIKEMNISDARQIAKWTYNNEYSIYSMEGNKEQIDELLDSSYYSVHENNDLIGYFCFGKSAQVPAGNSYGIYDDTEYIDIGLGLRPDLCGKGNGLEFIIEGMVFA